MPTATEAPAYPEHEKLQAISDQSQAIGEFLEWMGSEGIHRMVWRTDLTDIRTCPNTLMRGEPCSEKYERTGRGCATCDNEDTYEVEGIEAWVTDDRSIQKLLADYFDIDLDKIEEEKRAMIAALQEASG